MKITETHKALTFTIPKDTSKEIISAVRQLKADKCVSYSFPKELNNNTIIISAERAFGIRKIFDKGYDVLKSQFFVNESILASNSFGEIKEIHTSSYFVTFAEFFNYLNGDIYDNACYFGYTFTQREITEFNIDTNQLNKESLINYTIDDFSLSPTLEDLKKYSEGEKTKKRLIEWSRKFDDCKTYEQFIKKLYRTRQSSFASNYQTFFIFDYINKHPDIAFDIIMQYINENWSTLLEECLCLFYDPNEVLNAYNNVCYTKKIASNYKKDLQNFIVSLKEHPEQVAISIYFDETTHFYTHKISTRFNYTYIQFCRYFESFEELATFLNNDLSNADLTGAITQKFSKSLYKSNQKTKWPASCYDSLNYDVYKGYLRSEEFSVVQKWTDDNNNTIKKYVHNFKYYFDFLHFLKKDLSFANLLFCDNLENIPTFDGINIYNAKIRSNVLLKFGIDFKPISLPNTEDYPTPLNNEIISADNLLLNRISFKLEEEIKHQKI